MVRLWPYCTEVKFLRVQTYTDEGKLLCILCPFSILMEKIKYKNNVSYSLKWVISPCWHMYHTGIQEWLFACYILTLLFQYDVVFLFSPCISFGEVNRSLKWTVMKHLAHRKSFFLTSLVIAWEMTRSMTVYISLLLFPLITVDVLITFLNGCSQRWLEQKVFHFIRFRLIASVFHWISPCSCTAVDRIQKIDKK